MSPQSFRQLPPVTICGSEEDKKSWAACRLPTSFLRTTILLAQLDTILIAPVSLTCIFNLPTSQKVLQGDRHCHKIFSDRPKIPKLPYISSLKIIYLHFLKFHGSSEKLSVTVTLDHPVQRFTRLGRGVRSCIQCGCTVLAKLERLVGFNKMVS